MNKYSFKLPNRKSRAVNRYIGLRNNCNTLFLLLAVAVGSLLVLNMWFNVGKLFIIIFSVFIFLLIGINICFLFLPKGVYLYQNHIKIVTWCFTGSWYYNNGIPHKLVRNIYFNDIRIIELHSCDDSVNRYSLLMHIDKECDFITLRLNNGNEYAFSIDNSEEFFNIMNERIR